MSIVFIIFLGNLITLDKELGDYMLSYTLKRLIWALLLYGLLLH